jgi:UDPglucose 6-dehydrogenase
VINTAHEANSRLDILEAVVAVNERQKGVLGAKIRQHFGGRLEGRRVAVWGLAFKPGTDDVREAPSLVLIEGLLRAGATVAATDPVAIHAARAVLGDRVHFEDSHYRCVDGADALALVTEWHDYRRPNLQRLRGLMRQLAVFDGRNVWDAAAMRAAEFIYYGVGRPTV